MPPFDFGKQTGRAFQQSFQAAQDRQQQAKRQRAMQRFRRRRLEHLSEKARKNRQLQRELAREGTIKVDRSEAPYLPGEGTVRMDAGTVARQRRRHQQSTWDMIQSLQQAEQPGNDNMEVQRENVPQLPGTGPAMVNPNTMIRHGGGTGGSQGGAQGGSQSSSGSQGGGTASLPDSPEAAQEEIDRLVEQEQQAAEAGVSSDSLASTQKKILQLKKHRDSLRGGAPRPSPVQPDTSGADTTRSLRSTPTSSTDTTAAGDSTTTRGLGRSPGHVPPQELGMKTSGGNPGGGGGTPSSGGARLNPDLMGSADLNARGTESLAEDAMTVVWNRGPAEAERRLDGLVNQGYLDASKRDSVWSRVQQARREFSRRFGQQ